MAWAIPGMVRRQEEKDVEKKFFLLILLSAHVFQTLALPPLLRERGVKAGLKEYGEQAERRGEKEKCENSSASGGKGEDEIRATAAQKSKDIASFKF